MSEPIAARASLLARLGPRARRRAQPRFSVALGGAGCLLVVVGALVMGIDGGTGDGSFNRWPGLLLTVLVAAGGVAAQLLVPRGAVAAAGTVAVVLAVPSFLMFATVDSGSMPPYSADAILIISALAFGLAYLVGPGRGRPTYLGAAAIAAWASLLQLAENAFDWPGSVLGLFAFPIFPFPFVFFEPMYYGDESMQSDDGYGMFGGIGSFDPTTAGVISLAVGAGFVLLSRRLDRRGFAGAATPILVAAIPALYAGVLLLAEDLGAGGTGLLAVAIGAGLSLHASSVGRRATMWLGGLVIAAGVVAVVVEISTSAGMAGVLFVLLGAGLVAAGQMYGDLQSEPDEMAAPRPRRTEPLRAGDQPG